MAVENGKLKMPGMNAFEKLTKGSTMMAKTGNSRASEPKQMGSAPKSMGKAKLGSPLISSGEKVSNGKLRG